MSLDETKRENILHPFPPLYDEESRILILGSFPSVKSREQAFFYGHPQNRFWKTLSAVLGVELPVTIEEKSRMLHENHIALWDVIKSCDIIGSSDSSIKNVVPNDLTEIIKTGKIQKIYCNGAKSHEYFKKYQEKTLGMKADKLPSTSPANAACSLDKLKESWKVICEPLGITPPGIGEVLLGWYDYNGRILPWRSDPTPYHVWISEIMLQQTRVEAVKGYFYRWMEELPDISSVAEASDEKLMKLWEGLGYYNRVRNIKVAALEIMENHGGKMPDTYEEIRALKGIGEYTAGAISSIAYGKDTAAIDGNALRVFSRILAEEGDITKSAVKKRLTREVLRTMPKGRAGDFNQAIMDLGAMVCLPNGAPLCDQCPWESVCRAHRQEREMDYPNKPKKKARKIEDRCVFVFETIENETILHKRPPKGLLADLFEYPNLDGRYSLDKAKDYVESLGITDYEISSMGEKKHIFSHVEWHMNGFLIRLKAYDERFFREMKKQQWLLVEKDRIDEEYAIPSAFDHYKLK